MVFFKSEEYYIESGGLTPLYTFNLREFMFVATNGGYNAAKL